MALAAPRPLPPARARAAALCAAAALLMGCTSANPAFDPDRVDGAVVGTGGVQTGDAAASGTGGVSGTGGGMASGGTGPAAGGAEGGDPSAGGSPGGAGGAGGAAIDGPPGVDGPMPDTLAADAAGPGTRGLVLYWSFDETSGTVAQDSSGRGLHGTYAGTTLPAPDLETGAPTGFVNRASRRFTAASGHVVRLEGPSSALQPGTGLTVSVWFRTTATTRADLVGLGDDYRIRYSNGVLEFLRRRPPGSSATSVAASGNAAGSDGVWHHAAGVADPTGTSIWMDGGLVDKDVSSLPYTYLAGAVFAAGRGNNGFQAFDGWLDEVRVYDRALTDDEIKALALGAH